MPTNEEKYRRQIASGLDRAFKDASSSMSMELDSLRLIVLSDLHRGVQDGADDFRRCARACNAALAYYFEAGHTLCLLGDVEELWECRPRPVLEKYQHSFELERKYWQAGRYWRIWGNHDDLWSFSSAVQRYLGAIGLDGPVWESLRLEILDQGNRLGEIFFVHGHQGTMASDRYGEWSRLFVRYLWRPFQRLTGIPSTTPARDWELRHKHDVAMSLWARDKRVILFAGHTHRPVFRAESLVDKLNDQLAGLERMPDGPEHEDTRQALVTEMEWVRSSQFQTPPGIVMDTPCYFNTGCSSFGDGDVTGLEIADRKVKLVRWPDDAGRPLPQVLEEADLAECLEEVSTLRRAPGREAVLVPSGPRPEAPLH